MTARTRTLVALLALAVPLAACGQAPTPVPAVTPSAAVATPAATLPPSAPPGPPLTPVPGAATTPPPTEPAGGATTDTDWGTILDEVPGDFPVYPGAKATDATDGPASGAWVAAAAVDAVAAWYRSTLEDLGFTTAGLSSPLEDGSRVLDTVSDLPECRIQATFRPAGGSTMITVLYGAGCAGGEG